MLLVATSLVTDTTHAKILMSTQCVASSLSIFSILRFFSFPPTSFLQEHNEKEAQH